MEMSKYKSLSIRKEHRVTLELLQKIVQELVKPQWQDRCNSLSQYLSVAPWFAISTSNLLSLATQRIPGGGKKQ
jgi:hypothetical protein